MEYPTGFDSSTHRNKPICGVLALAMAAGVSYPVAHATARQALFDMNPRRKRFGGSTTVSSIDLALKRLGVRSLLVKIDGTYRLRDFVAQKAKPGVMYLVRVPGHIMTLKDGMLLDQEKLISVSQYKNRKLTHFWRIQGRGW